jgi:hypothetical protein
MWKKVNLADPKNLAAVAEQRRQIRKSFFFARGQICPFLFCK